MHSQKMITTVEYVFIFNYSVKEQKADWLLARQRGAILGRPRGKEKRAVFLKHYPNGFVDLNRGLTLRQCQKLHGVCRNTVIKEN